MNKNEVSQTKGVMLRREWFIYKKMQVTQEMHLKTQILLNQTKKTMSVQGQNGLKEGGFIAYWKKKTQPRISVVHK